MFQAASLLAQLLKQFGVGDLLYFFCLALLVDHQKVQRVGVDIIDRLPAGDDGPLTVHGRLRAIAGLDTLAFGLYVDARCLRSGGGNDLDSA